MYIYVVKRLHIMTLSARRDVFQAIADPNRRQIINLIARKSMNLNTITHHFDISRPSVSQHIKILNECGLVTIEKIGRERYCMVQPDNLKEVSDWVEQYRDLWEQKLDSFEKYLNKLHAKRKKK